MASVLALQEGWTGVDVPQFKGMSLPLWAVMLIAQSTVNSSHYAIQSMLERVGEQMDSS